MLTLVANLVTKFECVVFGSYSSYPLPHSTSYLRYFDAIGKHILMLVLNPNLLQMHGVEHVYWLRFILFMSCSREHV